MARRILLLFMKELLILLKDKRGRMVLIVPPIIQTIVFGYGANFDLERIPLAIYDEDRSAISRELISYFLGSPNFHRVATIVSDREIAPAIEEKSALAVLHVARDFEREVVSGGSGRLQLIMDGRNSNTASVTLRYTVDVVDAFFQNWERHHYSVTPRFHVETRAWFNENLKTRWYIVPGLLGLLTLVISLLISAMSVSREREEATLEQILLTPLSTREIFLSKAFPGIIIGTVEATLMLFITLFWFHIPFRGNLVTLYSAIGLLVLASSGIGLLISTIAGTLQQSVIGAFLYIIPAILLSGFVTPVANMTMPVKFLSYINPLYYFINISRAVFLEGSSLQLLSNQFWPLGLISFIAMGAAALMFRRELSSPDFGRLSEFDK